MDQYANRLISIERDEAAAPCPCPCPCSRRQAGRGSPTPNPHPDRFAIRAQSALTSISHISDLYTINTSTNHATSLNFLSETTNRVHTSTSHNTRPQRYLSFSRCHVEAQLRHPEAFPLQTFKASDLICTKDISVCTAPPLS
jgi:hypothetical protein